MKTTVLVIALILNTTFLFIEPLANLIQGVNPWVFGTLEAVLLILFLIHRLLKDLKETFDIDVDSINIFQFKNLR